MCSDKVIKCYICNAVMAKKEIIYDNPKWGDLSVTVAEKVQAYVCSNCGEIVFDYSEAVRLQELSQSYK